MSGAAAQAEALATDDYIGGVLADFGLSSVEIAVYRAALASGSRPASAIAQKAGLKRGHTYNILQSLMQKGIVQEFLKNSVRHFVASSPKSLVTILERREQELAAQKQRLLQVIPHLEQLRHPLASQPKVRFFKGLEGIKEIYEDMIAVPNQNIYGVLDVAYSWTFCDEDGEKWINSFIARRASRNVWWLGIMNKSAQSVAALRVRRTDKREVRFVDGLDLKADISIYGAKVAITSTHEELIGVIIENQPIADTLRSIHQRVWNTLPAWMPGE